MRLLADYLIAAGLDGQSELGVLPNGAIDIDSAGRIAALGRVAELGPADGEVHEVGGLLMPGLVNAHAHTPMTLVRSAGDGLPLQRWLAEGVWPREGKMTPDDVRWGMTIGSAEMLLAGITTTSEMYLFEEAVVDAAKEAGIRLVMSAGVIAALSPTGDISARMDEVDAFHSANHDPDAGVSIGYGPHSVYDLKPEQVAEIGQRARARDALVHIHLEETRTEREQVLAANGKSATQVLADSGVLEGRLLAAHGVWLDDTDRRLLGHAGAAVAHCPVSNLKLGSGVAPLVELLESGVTVGVGTDGPASNDNLDLWEEIKLAPMLARGTRHDAEALTAAQALDLGTRASAQAVGLADVGELRVGAWADVIRIDLDHPAFTPGREEELLAHVVWAGAGQHVSDVWIAGRRVVQDRSCLTVDVPRAIAEAKARGRTLAS